MISIVISLFFIFLGAFCVVIVINWLDREEIREFDEAKKSGKRVLLASCKDVDVEYFILRLNVTLKDKKNAIKIIELIQNTFDLKCMVPPSDFLLRSAMVIEVKKAIDGGCESKKYIEPYSNDLVEGLYLLFDKKKLKEKMSKDEDFPVSEDELIVAIINMTVEEFVRFCLPLMK
ncbi:hypothetical protein [Delftia acidovorans]